MSIARQFDTFAGENWQAAYQVFQNINFNATDPVSINAALQSYLIANFPENFNDWIVSSEFVAIVDLLSWLAGTLAFKTDLAARENFIDTAEARESILRLARFLSYNPSRCQPSIGVLQIMQVATDDTLTDSFGVDLTNVPVLWNDSNNSNWFEQFGLILNDAFVNTNPFGLPLSQGTVNGLATQLYRVNGLAAASNLSFSATVSGTAMDFEVCNGDFADQGTLFERPPDPLSALQFYYLNDGGGNASAMTGFFMLFKQGSTAQQTFSLASPVQNQLLDIAAANINQTDVWVDTVDDNGYVLIDWTAVSTVVASNNITYNNIPVSERYIFSVLTRDNDQISIRFSDGNFGNAPVGNIAVTYRVSNALSYQINPAEIQNIALSLNYVNAAGVSHSLTVTLGLTQAVSNSSSSETIEQIRQRAPQVYATQNRMVSGEDYNTFPMSSNLAVKIKAVNRLYSGQSRYIDLHDPTGTYRDLSLIAADGIFFLDKADTYFEVPVALQLTAAHVITNYIQPTLSQYTIGNLIRDVLIQNVRSGNIAVSSGLTWTQSSAVLFTATGWFNKADLLIQPGAMIQFNLNGTPTWVAVIDIQATITTVPMVGSAGPVTLSQAVASGSPVLAVLPQVLTVLAPTVTAQIQAKLSKNLSFSLWYDYQTNGGVWTLGPPQNDFGTPQAALNGVTMPQTMSATALLLMNVNYITSMWRINARGLRYVFESITDVQWYDNGARGLAQTTGAAVSDTVHILKTNQDLADPLSSISAAIDTAIVAATAAGVGTSALVSLNGLSTQITARSYALGVDYALTIDRLWLYADGTPESRRTTVTLTDSDTDGYADQPDVFYLLCSNASESQYLFWSNQAEPPYDQPFYTVIAYDSDTLRAADTAQPVGTVGFQLTASSYFYNETFWIWNGIAYGGWQQDTTSFRAARGRGPNVAAAWVKDSHTLLPYGSQLAFLWQHIAPSDHRLDPASTSIIDVFVLTYAYDTAVRQWIANGGLLTNEPSAPSELDLSIAFAAMDSAKMFSDTIVWRPVTYVYLFGATADPSRQAQFKVVRVTNSTVSDGEIQSKIIAAINGFFAISNWDFGETYYFSEMAAYVHQQLAGLISSIVLVPLAANASFGDGFELSCTPDQIFISTAQISDIVLIQSNTAVNLRMV